MYSQRNHFWRSFALVVAYILLVLFGNSDSDLSILVSYAAALFLVLYIAGWIYWSYANKQRSGLFFSVAFLFIVLFGAGATVLKQGGMHTKAKGDTMHKRKKKDEVLHA